jgi:soluble lytic murein transglycosylase-like protein
VDRHEVQGDRMVLYSNGGVTDLPAASIDHFEIVFESVAENSKQTALPIAPAPPPPTPVSQNPHELLRKAAGRSGLPPAFVESVAKVESAFRPDAVSPKGALGVMQLMPDTARALDANPLDTAQNIDAGVRLLRELLMRYDGDVVKALAAYNAGTDAVSRYRGVPPYPETQIYVDRVLRTYISNGGK